MRMSPLEICCTKRGSSILISLCRRQYFKIESRHRTSILQLATITLFFTKFIHGHCKLQSQSAKKQDNFGFIFRPHNLLCRGRKFIICVFPRFCQISTFYSILYLILRFTKEEAEIRKQALPFVPARYIRTFDGISEVNCALLRRKRKFDKIALYPRFDVIPEVN